MNLKPSAQCLSLFFAMTFAQPLLAETHYLSTDGKETLSPAVLATKSAAFENLENVKLLENIKVVADITPEEAPLLTDLIDFSDDDGFEIRRSRIKIIDGERGKCGTQDLTALTGEIIIDEMNINTFQQRKTIIPVDMRILDTGVLCKADSLGEEGNFMGDDFIWDAYMNIHNLTGNTLGDLFHNRFVGGEFSVGLIINLGYSSVENEKGIEITDFQNALVFRGLGIRAAKSQMIIVPSGEGGSKITINVNSTDNTSIDVKADLEEVIHRTF